MPQAVIDGHKETLEGGAESARMILKAGGRLGMGGDYGFAWNPHGDYAKELTFFVKYVGFTPLETITCATQDRRRDHGPRRRVRHAGGRQARRRAGRRRRRAGGHRGAGGPLAIPRGDAGRRRQGGAGGGAMTESEWLACEEPTEMLVLFGLPTDQRTEVATALARAGLCRRS